MRFTLDLDFCIIYNPIFNNNDYMIYFTRRNEYVLDYSLREEKSYDQLLKFMKSLGYMETDYLTFEFMGNGKKKKLELDEMAAKLIKKGAKYNIQFENIIKDTLEAIKQDIDAEYLNQIFPNNKPQKKEEEFIATREYNVPEIDGRINVFFYLFLECYFLDDKKCFLKLTGDFESRENTDERNFLRILNTDFKRIKSEREGFYSLETVKSVSEIVKSVPFLQGGFFQFTTFDHDQEEPTVKHTKSITYFYSILEIKNKLKPIDKIKIEVPFEKFNLMMDISSRIKNENKILEKETVLFEDITSSFSIIKKMAKKKMIEFADNEDFRKAASIQKDLKTIEAKECFYIDNISRDISKREYDKLFCFS